MIIAVDTLFMAERFRYTGTGIYLSHLLSACLKMAPARMPNVEFHGFRPPGDDWANNGFVSPFLRVHATPLLDWRQLWRLGGMAVHTARVRPNLVFLPTAHHSLPGRNVPAVTAILDAIPWRVPTAIGVKSVALHAMTWMNTRLADRIITISEWSKKDLVEIYRVKPEKIDVTYIGCDSDLFNASPPDPEHSSRLLARLGIRRPYVLHHGMVQLRKNVHGLIQAWSRVRSMHRELDVQLVLAGPQGHGYKEILRARQASPYRDQIILAGKLPGPDLGILVKNAALCVTPSFYEGFCLPMVEAMACGVPTVASNRSCLPEVSGGVLEYFDPHSIEEMAETIRHALEDASLRERLQTRGLARAADFSWANCAQQTLRIFAETVEANG